MKKIIHSIINISPIVVLLFLLNYVSENMREVKKVVREFQYYEDNDTVMAQILNEVASNNTLLLFVSILLISILIGVMVIIEKLSDNREALDELKNHILITTEQKAEKLTDNSEKEKASIHTDYMPK